MAWETILERRTKSTLTGISFHRVAARILKRRQNRVMFKPGSERACRRYPSQSVGRLYNGTSSGYGLPLRS
jgi:hypothetical protein